MSTYRPFTLTLRSRAVVTGLAGDPNSAATMRYIPGSSIRGVVAAAVPKDEIETFVLGDSVTYLNAYPVRRGERAFPVPLSWRTSKYGGEVFDLVAWDDELPGKPLGESPAEFVTLASPALHAVEVRVSTQSHHQRDREKGRAWKIRTPQGDVGKGVIFTYESLAAGQTFGGVVRSAREDLLNKLEQYIPSGSIISIGRSRLAGYGGEAVLAWGNARDSEVGESHNASGFRKNELLRVVLTSPSIVRDVLTGQPDPAALPSAIVASFPPGSVDIVGVRWGFTRAVAHNRMWRLRLPEMIAAAAGSVFVLRARSEIDADTIRRIEDAAIGERTNEGFGRLLVLQAPAREIVMSMDREERAVVERAGIAREAAALLDVMQRRILAERLDREIDIATSRICEKASRIPSRSLLSRLLVPMTRDADTSLQTMSQWLSDGTLALRRRALDQIEKCRVTVGSSQHRLDGFLRDQATAASDEDFYSLLQIGTVVEGSYLTSRESATACVRGMSVELRRRLIVRVLTSLQKKSKGRDAAQEVLHASR